MSVCLDRLYNGPTFSFPLQITLFQDVIFLERNLILDIKTSERSQFACMISDSAFLITQIGKKLGAKKSVLFLKDGSEI
jgi:hypothetical protein